MRFFLQVILLFACMSGRPACSAPCDSKTMLNERTPPARTLQCVRGLPFGRPWTAANSGLLYATLDIIGTRAVTAPSDQDVEAMRLLLRSLDDAGLARPADQGSFYAILLNSGKLDEARRFNDTVPSLAYLQFPNVVALPHHRPDTAHFWRMEPANVLREHELDVRKGAQVFVVASPSCHFCDDAATQLARMPGLAEIFRDHAIWMDRPGSSFGSAYYQRWQDAHPDAPMSIVLDTAHWPMPDQWSTPRFIFMRDGLIVSTVLGWTDQTLAGIRSGLAGIGLPVDATTASTPACVAPPATSDKQKELLTERVAAVMSPIHNRAELDDYLARNPIDKTPFGALSAGGRQRFIDSLKFGPQGGLSTYYLADIGSELTYSQAYRLLELFGAQGDVRYLRDAKVANDVDALLKQLAPPR